MSPQNHPQAVSLSKLTKIRLFLIYSFPVVLFCSYFPRIPIISTASTNYELSLPLIWLLLFSVLSVKDFLTSIYNIYKRRPFYLILFIFPIYLTLTTLWSINPLRAIMTAGIFWCLIITNVVIFTTFCPQKLIDSHKLLKIFFYATTAFCIVCWFQSILDVIGTPRDITLLCLGCTSRTFGFPHPSGLTIEPQFMGNLLIAPTLTAIYLWTKPKLTTPALFSRKTLLAFSFVFSSTLFLTFSRGAIYSFGIGLIILIIVNLAKLKNRHISKTIPLLVISGIFVILAQGLFSAVSYTDSTFLGGIEKSISQMTLGKINLNLEQKSESSTTNPPTTNQVAPETNSTPPIFDGYVEESTNTRLNFNRIALELSSKNATSLLFGYGLGSAGEVMFREGKTTTPYEIVQNEYLSLLLETGIAGIILATISVAMLFMYFKKNNRPKHFLLRAIIISFLCSLLFFSGLPNALHIYLFPAFIVIILPPLSLRHRS